MCNVRDYNLQHMVHSDQERDAKSLTLALISASVSGESLSSVVQQSSVVAEQPVVAEQFAVAERVSAVLESVLGLVPVPQMRFVRNRRPFPLDGMLK